QPGRAGVPGDDRRLVHDPARGVRPAAIRRARAGRLSRDPGRDARAPARRDRWPGERRRARTARRELDAGARGGRDRRRGAARGPAMAEERPPVIFVGAGPGEAGMLTLRGQRALAEAQVVVFDAALSPALLDLATDGSERIRVSGSPDDGGGGVPRAAVP